MRRDAVEQEFKAKRMVLDEANHRLRSEYQHKLHVSTDGNKILSDQVDLLQDRIKGKTRDLKDTEEQFLKFRNQTLARDKPYDELVFQVDQIRIERDLLAQKVMSSIKRKKQYKSMWSKLIAELGTVKEDAHDQLKVRLEIERKDLENLRIRSLVQEEMHGLEVSRQVLQDICQKVHDIKKEPAQ
jgi:hypothetical protein